jgi:hypothetical protein
MRRGSTAACLLLAAIVAGCGVVPGLVDQGPTNEKAVPPIIPVAAGQTAQGPYQVVVYRTSDGWTCMEIVGGMGGSSCGQGPDGLLGVGWSSGGPNDGGMITGGTKLAGASAVSVLFDDGTVMPADLSPVPAPIAPPGVAIYVIPYPGGRAPTRVDIVDANGTVLESTNLSS